MKLVLIRFLAVAFFILAGKSIPGATGKPFVQGRFQGRIAYSADGNHNDPDDWIASPVALAIFAEAGVKDRLVHFDYNCILPSTKPEWEKIHAESVMGAAERYGFDKASFFDCRKNLNGALDSLTAAINASSADDPLYLVIAGPVEVPYRALTNAEPGKRRFVYCLSHSRWNDGFASKYSFTYTKRSVIEQGVHWVQIRDQNRLLSFGTYGRPAPAEDFKPYFWMRDSRDAKVRWLWERMLVSTRPDPSDAGMAWFLVTGDEECDPGKLEQLMERHPFSPPVADRKQVRLEAENFPVLEGYRLDDRKDKSASHQLCVRLADSSSHGSIRTRFDEPFAPINGLCDIVVAYRPESAAHCQYRLFVNGIACGDGWESVGSASKWATQTIQAVSIRQGDEVRVETEGAGTRLDYVQLNFGAP